MADNQITTTRSLWRESFSTFSRHRQEWLKCALYFFAVMLPAGYVSLWNMGYSIGNPAILSFWIDSFAHGHDPEYIKAHRDAFIETMKNMPKPGLALSIAYGFAQLVVWVQIYVFYGMFLKYEGVVKSIKWDWKGFLYFIFKLILWWLVVVLWMLAGGLIIGLITVIVGLIIHFLPLPSALHEFLSALTFFCAAVVGTIGMLYLMLRYVLTFSLAAAWVKSPIKTSARLMEGNTWRFFWNFLWIYIMFMPILILIFLLMLGSGQIVDGNIPVGIILAIAYAGLMLFIGGLFSAFHATACRIFYQQKRQLDPSFVLETRE